MFLSHLKFLSLPLTLKTSNEEHVFYVPSLDEKSKQIWGGGRTGYTPECSQWSFLPFLRKKMFFESPRAPCPGLGLVCVPWGHLLQSLQAGPRGLE